MGKERKSDWLSWFKIVIIALIFALVVRKFLFSPIIVEGPSMQPTLYSQDQMIVNKFTYYFKQPERFDVIVFHASEEKDFIKRVIGLPGEHVMIKDDILYIDYEPVEQPFLEQSSTSNHHFYSVKTADYTLQDEDGNDTVIPENHLFVLGDNRHDSTDSRHGLGLVSMDDVVGKTNLIYWPPKRMQIIQ